MKSVETLRKAQHVQQLAHVFTILSPLAKTLQRSALRTLSLCGQLAFSYFKLRILTLSIRHW